MRDPRIALRIEAFAIGMMARVGGLKWSDLGRLLELVDERRPHEPELAREVTEFAEAFHRNRHNPEEVMRLGERLCKVVQLHCLPEPVDAGRRDIYG